MTISLEAPQTPSDKICRCTSMVYNSIASRTCFKKYCSQALEIALMFTSAFYACREPEFCFQHPQKAADILL